MNLSDMISIISILISVIVYFLSINKSTPLYLMKNKVLIPKEFSLLKELSIKYGNKEIKSITSTKVAIWNKGRKSLERSDMSTIERLKIEPRENVRILDYQLITESSKVNNVKFSLKEGVLYIDFEYFNKKQGIVINVIHTGVQEDSLKVKGEFKNTGIIRNGKRYEKWLPKNDNKKEYILIFSLLFIMIMGQINMSFHYLFVVKDTISENIFINALFFIKPILPLIYLSIWGIFYFSTFRIPKQLQSYYWDMGDECLFFERTL